MAFQSVFFLVRLLNRCVSSAKTLVCTCVGMYSKYPQDNNVCLQRASVSKSSHSIISPISHTRPEADVSAIRPISYTAAQSVGTQWACSGGAGGLSAQR